MVTLFPEQATPKLKEFLKESNAVLNPQLKRYVLRPSDLPDLVRAAEQAEVTLVPTHSLAAFLEEAAAELEATQNFVDSMGGDLYPYQADGVGFLYQKPFAILTDEMGLGKTVQALHALPPKENCAAVVVCPGFLASNWEEECRRWRSDLTPKIIKSRKEFEWPEPGSLVICSYGRLPETPDKHGRPVAGIHVIADEAQYVKNYKSQRTRNFRKISHRALKEDVGGCVWLLTGTPILNRPLELWALLQVGKLGKALYGSYDKFIKTFGGIKDGLGQILWTGKVQPDAMEPVRPYMLRRIRTEVLPDLPLKTRQIHHCPPPDKQLAATLNEALQDYGELLRESVEAWDQSLELFNGLSTARKHLAAAKITELLLLLPQYEDADEPVVVFSAHRGPIETLQSRPGWGAIIGGMTDKQRHETVRQFKAGELKGLACTIAAAGLGLTLTNAAHAIFVDSSWVPADNLQAEDRLCRIGQTRGVVITRIMCDHELDHLITGTLNKKLALLDKTTEKLNAPRTDPQRRRTARKLAEFAAELRGAD